MNDVRDNDDRGVDDDDDDDDDDDGLDPVKYYRIENVLSVKDTKGMILALNLAQYSLMGIEIQKMNIYS